MRMVAVVAGAVVVVVGVLVMATHKLRLIRDHIGFDSVKQEASISNQTQD
jgi:hypothetical protein